jgi:hypothetical protein
MGSAYFDMSKSALHGTGSTIGGTNHKYAFIESLCDTLCIVDDRVRVSRTPQWPAHTTVRPLAVNGGRRRHLTLPLLVQD